MKASTLARSNIRKNIRPLHLLLAAVLSSACLTAGSGGSQIFEQQFNNTDQLDLQNGATLGPDASGVSKLTEDKCYLADASGQVEGTAGPAAVVHAGFAPADNIEEFTITAWYKAADGIRDTSTLFVAASTQLIWDDKKNEWVLRITAHSPAQERPMYWFFSGKNDAVADWVRTGEWTFIAMTWSRAEGKVEFYQGSSSGDLNFVREMTRDLQVDPLSEGADRKRVFGNDAYKMDRAFNGCVDNVRMWSKRMDRETIEKIRQADLKNQSITLP